MSGDHKSVTPRTTGDAAEPPPPRMGRFGGEDMVERAFPSEPGALGYRMGMTLRDWFAGQALAGLLASEGPEGFYKSEQAAERALDVAEAMMAERDRRHAR